jgi:hypothetical protein
MDGAEGATAPGISQAKGPRLADSLESAPVRVAGATEGVTRRLAGKALRSPRQKGARIKKHAGSLVPRAGLSKDRAA